MKSNKKRILLVLAILTMAIVLSFVFVACGNDTNKTGTEKAADYKVTIHPNNGQGDIVWDITKAIPTITKDGFHIAGYFLDAQLTISTTLESLKATGITKNIDVYVKWEEDVCEHVAVTDAAVAPTCTEKGLTEGKHCSKCGKILKAQTEIDALGHDLENHAGQPATCTEKGWKEYVTCKREGCDYTTYREIAALGHTPSNWIVDVSATCENDGSVYKECSVCHVELERDTTSKLGHDIEHHGKKEATCTEIGWNEYDSCKRVGCGYTTYQEIPALGHTGGTATCTEQAVCTRCNEKYGDVLGHNYQNDVCTRCGTKRASEGLEYSLSNDGNGYTVTSIGTCTDTELVIPSKHNSKPVTSIGEHAFHDCTGLTSVTIGDSVTSIGHDAFAYCDNIMNIYYTGDVAGWCGISGLDSLRFSSRTLYIGGKKVEGDLIIPDSVTSIGDYAFYGCTGLTSITIGDGVKSIGYNAFKNCTGLTNLTIPDSVTRIGGEAFLDTAWYDNQPDGLVYAGKVAYSYKGEMPSNTSIVLKEGTLGIGDYAFLGCTGLTCITISDNVTIIGEKAFALCSGLTSITIGNRVTSIGFGAFSDCSKLTSITIPGSVKSIGEWAFIRCTGLTSITIDNGVTSIGLGAFYDCSKLTSITIPASVTSIGEIAFSGCTGLTTIIVEKGNTKYHSDGNCLIETESKTMIAGCKNSIIPADGSVTSIGVHALSGCTGLTSITIPCGVTNIDVYAFAGCSGLTSVTIGNNVTSIGEGAFHYCTGLTSVTIGESVTSIGHSAFENCTGLTSVYYAGTKEKWSAIKIASWNSALTSATLYYYSETEPALNADGTAYDGNFWHYDTDGNVVIWKKEN